MNVVPKEFIRVMPDAMRGFVSEAFQKAGTSEEDAAHIAHLLVLTDLRGVFQPRHASDARIRGDDA